MSKAIELYADESGARLDVFLATAEDISRSYAQKLIARGLVTVNGKVVKASHKTEGGDLIAGTIPDPEPLSLEPEDIPLNVVYEDDDILVVDKPAGLIVHPAPGNWEHTLVNALLSHCPDLAGIGGAMRPGIVHRLDKNTSGLMVVAKNDAAQKSLSEQIKQRRMKKRYLSLLVGQLSPSSGVLSFKRGSLTYSL